MNGFYLSYPETRPNAFSLGDLFCEEVFAFLVEGAFELLICLLEAL